MTFTVEAFLGAIAVCCLVLVAGVGIVWGVIEAIEWCLEWLD